LAPCLLVVFLRVLRALCGSICPVLCALAPLRGNSFPVHFFKLLVLYVGRSLPAGLRRLDCMPVP
jgi:hypothetical protein